MAFKYFNVKNGLVTGNILLHAGNGVIAANTFNGSLSVTDSANLGNVSNIKITGGQANYVLKTDGTGNLSWVEQSGGNSQVAGSNTQVQYNNNGSFGGSSDFTFDSTSTTLTANNFVATSSANLGNVANIVVTGGSNGYYLQTDGSGNLTWASVNTGITLTVDSFSGDGSNSEFILTQTPDNANYTLVSIGGVVQPRSAYTLTNNVLTFSSAPPESSPIEVTIFAAGGGGGGGGTTTPGGANTQIQFNDNGIFSGNTGLTFNKTTQTLTATLLSGNGNGLSNINGSNVTGTVANATYATSAGSATTATTATSATTSGTVTTAAQPNITSVGTLSSLTVTGNANVGNLGTSRVIATGNISGTQLISNIATGTAPLVVTSTTVVANLRAATANTANTANTVTTNAQPNITSVGSLTSLTVTGNANVGNLGTAGLIVATGNITGGNLITGGSLSVAGVSNLGPASNVKITGGTANFVLSTDGTGNLSWISQPNVASNIPPNNQTAAYVLVISDVGKYINITTGGVTVPSGVFSSGDTLSIYNNSASNQTITQGAGVTMYQVGTATTGDRTLAQRGLATLLCVGANQFVITGGGLT